MFMHFYVSIVLDAFTHYAKETKQRRFMVLVEAFGQVTSTEDRVSDNLSQKHASVHIFMHTLLRTHTRALHKGPRKVIK